MNPTQDHYDKGRKASLFLLRIAFGVFFFYSGLNKILTPDWSAEGFLSGAKTFTGMYQWFASSGNIDWVNFVNIWGQLLIGLGLLSGLFTRLACLFASLLMLLYYFPGLEFPYVNHGFIVDDHIIFIFAFGVLSHFHAGKIWGLDYYLSKKLKHPLI